MIGQAVNDNEEEDGPPEWVVSLVMAVGAELIRDFAAELASKSNPIVGEWILDEASAFISDGKDL